MDLCIARERIRLLILSCYSGDVEVVKLLLKHCDVKRISVSFGIPLHAASCAGHSDIVDMLIKSGANCNTGDKYSETSLHAASRAGHSDIVDMLIKSGADCKKSDEDGQTPPYAALLAGHSDIVDMLIKFGAYSNKALEMAQFHFNSFRGWSWYT